MTYYYYLASVKKLGSGNASLGFIETEPWIIPGFDYPVKREIFNSLEKEWQFRELLQYILNYTVLYEICSVQLVHLLNSDQIELRVQKKSNLLLNEIVDAKQLKLQEGHLLTIKKVPIS